MRRENPRRPPQLARRRSRAAGSADAVEALRRWAASLPWVQEIVAHDPCEPIRFTIDCAPLGFRTGWLLLERCGDPFLAPTIIVVLHDRVARRGIDSGWAVPITDVGDGRLAVAVATPETPAEYRALQALILVAYCASFSAVGSDEANEP